MHRYLRLATHGSWARSLLHDRLPSASDRATTSCLPPAHSSHSRFRHISTTYATGRFGKDYRLRPWLLLDLAELEAIEHPINEGELPPRWRLSHLFRAYDCRICPTQGSLLASVYATMLSLDSLNKVNVAIRGFFTVSLMLSLMAVYLALVQQRQLALLTSADTFRVWHWNGRQRPVDSAGAGGCMVKESSLAANMVLQAPFELLGIGIPLFLGILAAYSALAWTAKISYGSGTWPGIGAVFVFFVECTISTLAMFGHCLGKKDRELVRSQGHATST